jgi:aspartyl-tRNA(Asn)/glutamyl-tRNA(Gln) amidotransferase subunit B
MEIVSRPEIHSPEQARAYVAELRAVLLAIGVSDVKMEEGSMRVDANVSLRPVGTEALGTRAEIKNMNSLRSLARAIEHEIGRQAELLRSGGRVVQETRHWDEDAGRTHRLRSKEEAYDYRYFPEPDLVPVEPSAEWRERVRAAMPELPAARKARLIEQWGISDHDAGVLVGTAGLADYAEAVTAAGAPGSEAVKWVLGDLLAAANESGSGVGDLPLTPGGLADLVALVGDGTLSRPLAKEVLAASLAGEGAPRDVVAARSLAQVSDESALGVLVGDVLAAHPAEAERYRAGDDKARKKLRGFFMGKVMAASGGRGNPQALNRILDERLGG